MTPEICPGCGAKLRPEMLACPNCPLSFPEDDGPRHAVNPLKESPYYQFLLPALFFAAIGSSIWFFGVGMMRLGKENAVVENGNMFGAVAKSSPAPASATRESPVVALADPEDQGTVIISRETDAGSTSDIPAPPPRPRAIERAAREWKLRGTVYDLTTLKPLAGVFLSFVDEATNKEIMTRTDVSGRYRAIVPRLKDRGYVATLERGGYAPNYLNPSLENVRRLSDERRRELARGLAKQLTGAPIALRPAGSLPLVTDFYLAPSL